MTGAEVPESVELRSQHGRLALTLSFETSTDDAGNQRFCYMYEGRAEAPTLRVNPGDIVTIQLKNDLPEASNGMAEKHNHQMDNACGTSGSMGPSATNMHFHGLNIPPTCHQDEVVKTLVQPGDPPYQYQFKIPDNEPSGLYWYHPHPHGFSEAQVLGGASGSDRRRTRARDRAVAGLPERVIVVRDQLTANPDDDASLPAKDLTINFVPVLYPAYTPAVISMKPGERQLWRLLNASAETYLDLQLLFGSEAQQLEVVALDGVPLTGKDGLGASRTSKERHILIPPGGRAEYVVRGPGAPGVPATLVTRMIDTGPDGDNDPVRTIAKIVARQDSPEPQSSFPAVPPFADQQRFRWLEAETPIRERKLYFSETLEDPSDPDSPTTFFITVDGQVPKAFVQTTHRLS